MKISKRQKQEIDFLQKHFNAGNDEQELKEYINWTVNGIKKGSDDIRSDNSIYQAKRRLDMMIKMWRQDMHDGLLAYWELEEDFDHPYFNKVLKSIREGLPRPKPSYGNLGIAALAYLNWNK